MILAIDTSTASASAALYDGESVLAEVTWQTGPSATVHLLPVIQQCFSLARRRPADLSGLAVALGPGSFNGLRAGLSLAKGLAYSLGRPIVGMATPDVAAYPFSALLWPVCVILQAGRGRVVRALFQTRYGRWQRIGDFSNTTIQAICQETERSTVFCGEIDGATSALIRAQLGQRALVSSTALSARRAGYLAEMAWKRLQDDPDGDDLFALQPIYLSHPRMGALAHLAEEEE